MEFQTPGVYVREVDSGSKPIASVPTSIPGFLGLFHHTPATDAVAINASGDGGAITGKVLPQLVDASGAAKEADAGAALTAAFNFKSRQVKDLKKLLELNGHKVKLTAAKGKVKIASESDAKVAVSVSDAVLSADGKVVSEDDALVEGLLNDVSGTFALSSPKIKHAKDLLAVYGYKFEGAEETALSAEYSVAPVAVTNKSEFLRWLQGYFAEYLLSTNSIEDLVGASISDPDDAVDAVFAALSQSEDLKARFTAWLSEPSVFNFVAGVNGYYDNGGEKAYVYLMGAADLDCSIRENQADKLGLYAFDDNDDMALMVAPGLNFNQQREMLEHCETRKDRFAILDGPIVSSGDMEIPASDKGYGAMYTPWVKVTRPSWYEGTQEIDVSGPNRRKLIKAGKNEVYVPPSGHMAGVFCRVDGTRGVHKAPANELCMGITGLSQNINRIEQGQYNDRGINVIRIFKDRGIRVWGARTLATKSDPSWKYINVRRLFIMVEQSVMAGSQWSVFEPNDHGLWKKLTRDVTAYLLRVWSSGALFGQTAEEAFYVKCDDETNPRYLIDAGQVNIQVGICPVKPAEFVVFSIGQWDGGALIEE